MSSATFRSRMMLGVNAVVMVGVALYLFIGPGCLVVSDLADPAVRSTGIPRAAWRSHRYLAPRYARWARARVVSGAAGELDLYDVPSTEWPIFGSVYYLWATENLQAAWERGESRSDTAPAVYAAEAIEACVDLVMDPVHHTWVRKHWGDNYMHRENAFFRSLIIAGLTSYENLTGNARYRDVLLDQTTTLARELDRSRYGVLDDYPGECYPIDILAVWACIKRADPLLGTDHSELIERARRAFEGDMLDPLGLPPFCIDSHTGEAFGPSRGVGNSYVLIFLPELWPDLASEWYARYEAHFWQKHCWAEGFREFPPSEPDREWSYDVDAGPILAGFSPAANAFGVAAAKVNGRLDHAYTLGTQVLAACWPLPGGGMLGTRLLSDPEHAPYLGETCMLFFLSHVTPAGTTLTMGGGAPPFVGCLLGVQFGVGGLILLAVWLTWRRKRGKSVPAEGVQYMVWLLLLATSGCLLLTGHTSLGLIAILLGQLLPRVARSQ
jgi:hypothetical protein